MIITGLSFSEVERPVPGQQAIVLGTMCKDIRVLLENFDSDESCEWYSDYVDARIKLKQGQIVDVVAISEQFQYVIIEAYHSLPDDYIEVELHIDDVTLYVPPVNNPRHYKKALFE